MRWLPIRLPVRVPVRSLLLLVGLLLPIACGAADSLQTVTLTVNDVIYDPGTGLFYASLPSRVGPQGNSIVAIDPVSGEVGSPVFVGSEPDRLALSGDGQALYVGLDGAGAVRRFDLATGTAGPQFPLPPNQGALLTAAQIEAVPGTARSVAILTESSFGISRNLQVFDDGVARPNLSSPISSTFGSNAFAFSPVSGRLYSVPAFAIEGELYRYDLSSAGLQAHDRLTGLFDQNSSPVLLRNGVLYSGLGAVVDPEAGVRLGSFTGLNLPEAFEVDPAAGRAFFVDRSIENFTQLSIRVYDTHTFEPLGEIPLPDATFSTGVIRLVRWGVDGLALATSRGVELIHTSYLPGSSSVDLQLSLDGTPASTPAVSQFTYTVTVRNAGATTATDVLLTDALPTGTTFVTGEAGGAPLFQNGQVVSIHLGNLTPGQAVTVHLTVTAPVSAGSMVNEAAVSANETDARPADNRSVTSTLVTAPLIPDLTGSWAQASLHCRIVGSHITCRYRGSLVVKNLGLTASGRCLVRFYQSANPGIDSTSTPVTQRRIGAVPPGGSLTVPLDAIYTGTQSLGGQYLVAVIDAEHSVAEADETNNVIASKPL